VFARDVAGFMDSLGIERAVIVGHSMGSTVAQRFAVDYPQRVRALVLEGAFMPRPANSEVRKFLAEVAALEDPIAPGFARAFQQCTLAQPVPPEFFETVVGESLKVPARVWQAALQPYLTMDFSADLADIAVPTLWSAVGRAAVITWPVTVGAEVAWRVPEYWRAGTVDDQKLVRSLSTPHLLDNVAKGYPALWSKLTPPDVKDEAQFAIAKHLLATEDPDLVLMHVWSTDDAQHAHGPRSAQAKQAIEDVDKLLGDLLAQLEQSPDWERTLLVVVSDHGFAAIEEEIQLDVLLAPNAFSIANGGSAYVYV
jgi:pimeloyl-ACP methyl ester carboxylesterase